jgi:hypothetical protein
MQKIRRLERRRGGVMVFQMFPFQSKSEENTKIFQSEILTHCLVISSVDNLVIPGNMRPSKGGVISSSSTKKKVVKITHAKIKFHIQDEMFDFLNGEFFNV